MDQAARPGQTPERLGFFTDAVFAIAMTLLVIEIPHPEGDDFDTADGRSKSQVAAHLWHFLVQESGAFYSYLLAFLVLWIVWRQHHTTLDRIVRLDGAMTLLHLPLLLLTGFLPYATAIVGHHPGNPAAALLFGLVVLLLMICRSSIQTLAGRPDVLSSPALEPDRRLDSVISWLVTGYWALTLLLVWWAPWVQLLWFLSGALARALTPLLRPRLAPTGPIPAPSAAQDVHHGEGGAPGPDLEPAQTGGWGTGQ
ncbi:TMEM175 family protein [Kitasatospora sp. NPDC094015]|uniref:TMEM175 family protein n=1 Tax=Kitasatospora sp. NPDC094015 TaxID=3155205 RepID=UPI00331C4B9A